MQPIDGLKPVEMQRGGMNKRKEEAHMRRPEKCVDPAEPAERYCLDDRDMDNLLGLMEEANDILDFYHDIPQNMTGILATAQIAQFEKLMGLVDEFRDKLFRVEFIGERGEPDEHP